MPCDGTSQAARRAAAAPLVVTPRGGRESELPAKHRDADSGGLCLVRRGRRRIDGQLPASGPSWLSRGCDPPEPLPPRREGRGGPPCGGGGAPRGGLGTLRRGAPAPRPGEGAVCRGGAGRPRGGGPAARPGGGGGGGGRQRRRRLPRACRPTRPPGSPWRLARRPRRSAWCPPATGTRAAARPSRPRRRGGLRAAPCPAGARRRKPRPVRSC
mmetsp:Transcript_68557/g.214342  ORF Transcript_68557/g.214342 Transcript_68557/m.214342 type:complete len:213 (-) Transcript_68557:629-1267(-)